MGKNRELWVETPYFLMISAEFRRSIIQTYKNEQPRDKLQSYSKTIYLSTQTVT